MGSSRQDDDSTKPGEAPARREEDREAILSRRKFLIESALASAGITLGVGVAGCGPSKKETAPQVCLSVAPVEPRPTECLKVAPPPPPDAGAPASQPVRPTVCLQPRPCLSVPRPPEVCLRVAPQKCLKIAPQRPDGGMPRPCLSRPRPCLQPKKPPSGKICLSEF
jgi:hypothetical protein